MLKNSQYLATVITLASEISQRSNADVFVWYMPHTSTLTVNIYANGWHTEPGADELENADAEITEKSLKKLIGTLMRLATKKGVKIDIKNLKG